MSLSDATLSEIMREIEPLSLALAAVVSRQPSNFFAAGSQIQNVRNSYVGLFNTMNSYYYVVRRSYIEA
jgi:hypothetical protein